MSISIHPPRAGRDVHPSPEAPARIDISIHPPRAGRDLNADTDTIITILFQSTRPVRGGTAQPPYFADYRSISIHPPRAGRDFEH